MISKHVTTGKEETQKTQKGNYLYDLEMWTLPIWIHYRYILAWKNDITRRKNLRLKQIWNGKRTSDVNRKYKHRFFVRQECKLRMEKHPLHTCTTNTYSFLDFISLVNDPFIVVHTRINFLFGQCSHMFIIEYFIKTMIKTLYKLYKC